jgi:ABC-type phosphate transport system substrate-binding protein
MRNITRFFQLYFLLLFLTACAGNSSSSENPPNKQIDNGKTQASITNIGSDTMVNLALLWAEAYHAGTLKRESYREAGTALLL